MSPPTARADGAFPDSMQVLLPADRPHEIILTTNFGLIFSEDDGQSWTWACEPDINDTAIFYQVGASPQDRLFATLLRGGLVYSDDGACSWTAAAGSLTTARATDVFPDASDPTRLLAIGSARGDGRTPQALFASSDGGATFGPALFTAPVDGGLLGVESARADPLTIYLSMYTTPGVHPILVTSADGGSSWTEQDLEPALGNNGCRIIAVDPQDPKKMYLRVTEAIGEALAITTDGGATFTQPVITDDALTAFARLGSGTVLVAGNASTGAIGFRSSDGGATFQPWLGVPHLRALAERDGKLYAAADNFRDGFAAGVSSDEGLTFQPLLTYDKVMRIKPCVQSICQDTCDYQAGLTLWDPSVCTGGAPPPTPAPAKSGCSCRAAGDGAPPPPLGAGLTLLGGLVLAVSRRRPNLTNRRRPRCSRRSASG